jgi:hypothetical protein
MFKIISADYKVTFCTTKEICAEVEADYVARGAASVESSDVGDMVYCFDLGGSRLITEEPFCIDNISFLPRHAPGLLSSLEHAHKRGTGYVKIHGKFNCLCLSINERDALVRFLKQYMDWFQVQEDKQWLQWRNQHGA